MKILVNVKYNNDPVRTCKGIMKNNELLYNENGFKVKMTSFPDKLLISKENQDYKVLVNLFEKDGFIEYKGVKEGNISLRLENVSFQVIENSVNFSYTVENNSRIECSLKYEVIE